MTKHHPAPSAPQSHCAAFAFSAISAVKSPWAPGPQTLSLQTLNPEPGTLNQPPYNSVHSPNPMIANSLPKITPEKIRSKPAPKWSKTVTKRSKPGPKRSKRPPNWSRIRRRLVDPAPRNMRFMSRPGSGPGGSSKHRPDDLAPPVRGV
jgi:hypothetical protein